MPTRILHVLSSLKVGGAERFALDLAEVQRNGNDVVTVYSCNAEDDFLLCNEQKAGGHVLRSTGSRLYDYVQILNFFRGSGQNAVHIHSPAALRYLSPLLLLFRFFRVRIVYTRHGLAPLQSDKWKRVHQLARWFVSSVTFVSHAGRDIFENQHHWPLVKHDVIENGAFVPNDLSPKSTAARLRLGSVGRMVTLKGQHHLLETLATISPTVRDQLEVHFFGEGAEQGALRALTRRLDLENCVTFHGVKLDREEIYSAFDVLVVCSESEGLSLAIMEAMAREIPVVATSVGDTPRLVLQEETGFLYDYGDWAALSEALLVLSQNRDMIAKLGNTARTYIENNYSLVQTNAKYQKHYRD